MNVKYSQKMQVVLSGKRVQRLFTPLLLLLVNLIFARAAVAFDDFDEDEAGFAAIVRPYFLKNCLRCHGPESQEGNFRVDELSIDMSQRHIAEKWHELLNRINKGEMPPSGEPEPDSTQQSAATDWISKQLKLAAQIAQSTGGRVVLRRLNRMEYNNTIRDLVGVDYEPAANFPADPPAFGFDNIGSGLTISPLHIEKYLAAAREIVDRAIVEGERPNSRHWHMEVEDAHHSNQFDGRESAGDSELWAKDPHHEGHRFLIKGGGVQVKDGWLIKKRSREEGAAGFRWFRIPQSGTYLIRIRAAARVPSLEEVENSVQQILWQNVEQELLDENQSDHEIMVAKETWLREEWAEILADLRDTFYYNYGSPRMKIVDGNGAVVDEFSVDAPIAEPRTYEIRHEFQESTGKEFATIAIENSYVVPSDAINHWFLNNPKFARPELWIDWVEIEGPHLDAWPPASQEQLLFDSPNREDETIYAAEVLGKFMSRAFRRPVREGELQDMIDLFRQVRPQKNSFQEAIKVPLIATLCSPHFLFLLEPNWTNERRDLNDFELASRLSYFLWSSMPDDELFRIAESGTLTDPEILRHQVRRMLKDAKSREFVRNFAGQWLGLREVGANPPSRDLFPRYDDHLQASMVRESEAFFAEILDHDLDVMNFISSDFVTINNRLARFYEIPGISGDHMRRVAVTPSQHRGGVITQASVLTTTSNGTRTSPVIRGKWMLENLLGDPPPPPPPDAGDIKPRVPGIDKATVRKRLEHHRNITACANCHEKIDPLGFALENFAADGSWRQREGFGYKGRVDHNDPLIDASGRMPDGKEFSTFEEFRDLLQRKDEAFLRCFVEKLTTYALGRGTEFSDQEELQRFATNMQENGRTIRGLIEDIVTSRLFLTK